MQKEIQIRVSDNLTISDYSGTYTRDDLARAVSYWKNKIDAVADPRLIAICFGAGSTSFQTVAVLLALIDSGRSYYKFDQLVPGASKETIKYPKIEGGVSCTIIVGTVETDFDYSNDPDVIEAESNFYQQEVKNHNGVHSLAITFRLDQKRYNNTSGTSTGFPTLIEASVGNDGFSIKTAMDSYIDDEEHCVFLHGMSHIGVHTTAILPAIFKAKKVTFAESNEVWQEKTREATHCQFFYTMLDHYKLPATHNIKTVTTGGDFLTSTLVKELIVNKGVKRIIDIYGLTEAAPPLAIREITCLEDLEKPFIWINDAYSCQVNEMGVAIITRPDGVQWGTSDHARYNTATKEFYYLGRQGINSVIRINRMLLSTVDFRQEFEKITGIVNYFLDTTVHDVPKLIVLRSDETVVSKFIEENEVTINLELVDNFFTNGGIKNTR